MRPSRASDDEVSDYTINLSLMNRRSFHNNISSPKPRLYANYLCFGVNLKKSSRKELCGKAVHPDKMERRVPGHTGATDLQIHSRHSRRVN